MVMTGRSLQLLVARKASAGRLSGQRQVDCMRSIPHTFLRWQSTENISPFAAKPPKPAALEVGPECHVDKPSFPKLSIDRSAAAPKTGSAIDLTTTRPAPLDPPQELDPKQFPNQSIPVSDRAKYLFRLGRAYLAFYKTGIKNIWGNYKQYQTIRRRISPHAVNEVAKYGGQTRGTTQLPTISHAEYQLYIRTRHDLFKLIPFSLVFLICGEFTPLVIIALGSVVVPYTCRIPRQEQKDLENTVKRDQNYMNDLVKQPEFEAQAAWKREWHEAYRYGLTAFRQPLPVVGSLYHKIFIHSKIVKHCNNLLSDTTLILREGGFTKVSPEDVYDWADKYGLYTLRQLVKKKLDSKQDLDLKAVKRELLPAIEGEVKFILDRDWERLKPTEHWRSIFRSVGSKSPDWLRRTKDVSGKSVTT